MKTCIAETSNLKFPGQPIILNPYRSLQTKLLAAEASNTGFVVDNWVILTHTHRSGRTMFNALSTLGAPVFIYNRSNF